MYNILLLDKKKNKKGVILSHGSGPEDCGSSSGESEGTICIRNYVFIVRNYICINVLYS